MNKSICCAMLAILAGCTTPTPGYDARFGDAVRQARSAMILNPNAAPDPDPVAGIDGQSARDAVKLYRDTYKEPPPVVNVINIGGAAGSK